MHLCLFSSLFLSLAGRVGREKGRMGREAPGRGKLPPDQAIEVRRRRKKMLIPVAVPCTECSDSFIRVWAWWVCVRFIKPKLEQFSLPRKAHPLTWFSNTKQHASENTTWPQGCCTSGCLLLNSLGLPCLLIDTSSNLLVRSGLVCVQLPSLSHGVLQAGRQSQRCFLLKVEGDPVLVLDLLIGEVL